MTGPDAAPCRVLHVDTGTTWRGGQRQVALLVEGLRTRGIAVAVAAPAASPLHRWAARRGIVTASLPRPANDLAVRTGAALARMVGAWGAALVHAHDGRSHAAARIAAVLHGPGSPPLVVTRRVVRPPRGTWKYRRGVSRYIAVSRAVQRTLLEAGIAPERVVCIPSGIVSPPRNEPPADLTPLGLAPGTRIVVVLAALSPEKGVVRAIEAAARLRSGSAIHWIVAGEGPTRPALERVAKRLKAPVSFLGFSRRPGELLRAADLLVHTPTSEALGTSVLEALARGVPVVATDVGGLREIIRPDVGGLVPPDATAIAAAASRWLARDPAGSGTCTAGPSVARRFHAARMIDRTAHVYATLAATGEPVPG